MTSKKGACPWKYKAWAENRLEGLPLQVGGKCLHEQQDDEETRAPKKTRLTQKILKMSPSVSMANGLR